MTPQEVLNAAKVGNPQAIAALMNRSLQPKGITAKAKLTDDCLHVMLEGFAVPHQAAIVPYVTNGIKGLKLATVKSLAIYGRATGEDLPAWSDRVELTELVPIALHKVERIETRPQEDDPVRCPNCSSAQVMATKKGFGTGNAAIGAVLLGPVGLAGGMIGANKIALSCLKCGHQWDPSVTGGTQSLTQVDTRITQTKIKPMPISERIGLSIVSVVFCPIFGLIVLIVPLLGWFLYAGIVLMGVFVYPYLILSGDPKYINNLVGDCPHCWKEAKTSVSSNSFSCVHCKKQVIVRDQQFYSL